MSKRRGTDRERKVVAHLIKQEWVAFRAPGSLGAADVIAIRPNRRPLFVQVKSDRAGPYAHFGPAARAALLTLAGLGGGDPWLCWWPPRDRMYWIDHHAWPATRMAV